MPRLTDAEISSRLNSVPGWEIRDESEINQLTRAFEFENFATALEFTNSVGELAEKADHHPRIVTEWGRVVVSFWSHDHGGVVEKDFVMAGQVNNL
ncbi:MAG: 4a-hydroxytetrahydrobiopterin dehydratase [Chloroflexi bacterium]|nr:4a-hydroxytetrahydrobiopterin dehydratase [Chloroflexota bacterium]